MSVEPVVLAWHRAHGIPVVGRAGGISAHMAQQLRNKGCRAVAIDRQDNWRRTGGAGAGLHANDSADSVLIADDLLQARLARHGFGRRPPYAGLDAIVLHAWPKDTQAIGAVD